MFDVPSETPFPFVLIPIAWVLHILCVFHNYMQPAGSHMPFRYFDDSRGENQRIPLFILSKCHPPSPDALRNPGLVNAVHRIIGRSRIAPRNGWPPLVGGVGTRPNALEVDPGQNGMGSSGRRPFLSGPISTSPYPTSHTSAMA